MYEENDGIKDEVILHNRKSLGLDKEDTDIIISSNKLFKFYKDLKEERENTPNVTSANKLRRYKLKVLMKVFDNILINKGIDNLYDKIFKTKYLDELANEIGD